MHRTEEDISKSGAESGEDDERNTKDSNDSHGDSEKWDTLEYGYEDDIVEYTCLHGLVGNLREPDMINQQEMFGRD